MKRTPLSRRTPLKPGQPLRPGRPMERHTRIKPVNEDRRKARHAEQFGDDGAYAAWLRTLPCVCCGRWERGKMHAHHVRSRGAGGTERDLVVLLWECHERGHRVGWQTWQRETGVDLRGEADRLWLRWQAFVSQPQWTPPL